MASSFSLTLGGLAQAEVVSQDRRSSEPGPPNDPRWPNNAVTVRSVSGLERLSHSSRAHERLLTETPCMSDHVARFTRIPDAQV
jgi:hypothetical protein